MIYDDFINLKYEPKKDDLIALFYIEPNKKKGISIRRAAGAVAAESSVGTWADNPMIKKKHVWRISAKVYKITKEGYVYIAYPLDNFEPGNMPQIYSAIAGNIFGMKAVNNIRLVDVKWPKKLLKSFKGPNLGLRGVQRTMGIRNRPIIACVPKPKVGLTAKEQANVAYNVWYGGVDLVKDDENLTNQRFDKFKERVDLYMKARDKVEKEVGGRKAALINVTSPANEIEKRIKYVAEHSNPFVMIDIITTGWSALQYAREIVGDYGLGIHAHRAMHAAFTRSKRHGISMLMIAETARIIGVDNIHVGTIVGKLEGGKTEVTTITEHVREVKPKGNKKYPCLSDDFTGVKPATPVSSGGLHPGLLPYIVDVFGNDLIIQVGGGIHGHPKGSMAGAMAVIQALEAIKNNTSLEEYAKSHEELKEALKKWGRKRTG